MVSAMTNFVLLGLVFGGAHASRMEMGKNPIRKVVTLMQNMQKELEGEGEKEKELYEKFMCFCKTSYADLTKKDDDAKAKIDELGAKLKAESAEKTQIAQELVDHKKDREAAKADLEEATSLRTKEAGEFAAAAADAETNIAAMGSAIPALEKGMSGAVLLQSSSFRRIRQLVSTSPNMDAMDQRDMLAFLDNSDGSGEYSPGTGQILGILKQMKEEFEGNLKSMQDEEASAKAGFAELKASKEKEIEVATESIETKMGRSGELAVSVVQSKDGLEDSTEDSADALKTLEAVKTQCAAKEKEYTAAQKDRADEMSALSQAIGVLNDDDALDVFKKAVPAFTQIEWTGFLQRSVTKASAPQKAQAILEGVAVQHHSSAMDLMLFTMRSKLKSHSGVQKFEEIKKMIDDMVVLLGKQQDEDDKTKEWCRGEFDKADDEEKAAKTKVAATQAALEEMTDAVSTLMDEIKAVQDEIIVLDKSVADATVQRKADHTAYMGVIQMNEAAIALIEKAKGKLEKFYKPGAAAASFIQVRMHTKRSSDEFGLEDGDFQQDSQQDSANQAQAQKSRATEKYRNVMSLMDSIIHDTKMAQKDAEYAEKTAQDDYAGLMAESQESRAQASKSLTDKTAAKADLEGKLVVAKEDLSAGYKAVDAIGKVIADLHSSCDFLIENYDMRKEARAGEIDSLKNAKAVLSGATL
jgi:chromosome segregation ATPase